MASPAAKSSTRRAEFFARRLSAQQLATPRSASAHELVGTLGAVQAQDYGGSLWALAVRLRGPLELKGLVRMHALRGTWQWVAQQDVRWLLDLVGQLELRAAKKRHEGLGLNVAKSTAALEKALREGPKTREELREVTKAKGPLLMHMLWAAELEGVITTGEQQGTYMLLDERVPRAKPRSREESVADLARRYFVTRGPATAADFVWWSGLTAREARQGVEAVKHELATDDTYYWSEAHAPARGTWLLPPFDEFLIAYTNRDEVLAPDYVKQINAGGGLLSPCIVVDGRVVGTWKRVLKKTTVEITPRFFERPHELTKAAARYASFVGREATVSRKP